MWLLMLAAAQIMFYVNTDSTVDCLLVSGKVRTTHRQFPCLQLK